MKQNGYLEIGLKMKYYVKEIWEHEKYENKICKHGGREYQRNNLIKSAIVKETIERIETRNTLVMC